MRMKKIAGYSVSSAGDVDGDGLDDILLELFYDDPATNRENLFDIVLHWVLQIN